MARAHSPIEVQWELRRSVAGSVNIDDWADGIVSQTILLYYNLQLLLVNGRVCYGGIGCDD